MADLRKFRLGSKLPFGVLPGSGHIDRRDGVATRHWRTSAPSPEADIATVSAGWLEDIGGQAEK